MTDNNEWRQKLVELQEEVADYLPDEVCEWTAGYGCALTNVLARVSSLLGDEEAHAFWTEELKRYTPDQSPCGCC